MPVNNPSRYPLRIDPPRKRSGTNYTRAIILVGVVTISGVFLLPQVITLQVKHIQSQPVPVETAVAPFPVSVNPAAKSIVENPAADAFFQNHGNSLTAALGNASDIVTWIAALITDTSLYQSLASVNGHLIVVKPGYRKEEVLTQLTAALGWNKTQQQQFLDAVHDQTPELSEGMFTPGSYVVDRSMTPTNVASLMNLAFYKNILVHYSTTTAEQVPLADAITVASLLEREAAGTEDMRLISGIIWNRLFNGMNLQIDATLQYAKGQSKSGNWWQKVLPSDKYVKSPYNTYAHAGLPPGPIANPSVASVLAALNPVQTSCLFYFHDSHGVFHCSDTYKQHVALLKKYYGQGK